MRSADYRWLQLWHLVTYYLCIGCECLSSLTRPQVRKVRNHALVRRGLSASTETEEDGGVVSVVRRCAPSVLYVSSATRRMPLGSGSGFLVSDEGYVVTNYHVIQAAHRINNAAAAMRKLPSWLSSSVLTSYNMPTAELANVTVKFYDSSRTRVAKIVDVRPEIDMAVLRILRDDKEDDDSFPKALPWGCSALLNVGQSVIAIGNPFGFLDSTVTTGIVSGLKRNLPLSLGSTLNNCIQIDAAINPGNSGGPLLDSKGRVIGINTATLAATRSTGIGFAVPIDPVKKATGEIIRNDRIALGETSVPGSGYLGVELAPDCFQSSLLKSIGSKATGLSSPGSAIVLKVQPNSPASKGGLSPFTISTNKTSDTTIRGDKIIAVGGRLVKNYVEVEEEMSNLRNGEQIALTLESLQDGNQRVVYVTLSLHQPRAKTN
jgi:S1-C subfamily serine protease